MTFIRLVDNSPEGYGKIFFLDADKITFFCDHKINGGFIYFDNNTSQVVVETAAEIAQLIYDASPPKDSMPSYTLGYGKTPIQFPEELNGFGVEDIDHFLFECVDILGGKPDSLDPSRRETYMLLIKDACREARIVHESRQGDRA